MPTHSPQFSKKPAANKPSPRGPRPTILHVCADLEPGDPARQAVDLAVLTQRAGWRALIASRGGLLVPEAERAAVRHTRMPLDDSGVLPSLRNRMRLSALIQKERPVIIHAHGLKAVKHTLGIARLHKTPLIADFTNPLPDRASTRRLLTQLGKVVSAVRVPSEFMARQLREMFGWPESRMQIVAPGIDTKWCDPSLISAERLQALSHLWRLPEQEPVIVMPMPFISGGGHATLLEALAQLAPLPIYTVLTGDNRPDRGYRQRIEELVDAKGLGGRVIMPDYCLDWPAACWLANAVVMPNAAPRGQALELLVAQAIGRPAIVSDSGANREMVPEGEGAWVVPADNVAALAEALREAITLGTDRRLQLARHVRSFVGGAFPQADWFNGTMDLYNSVLMTRTPRAETQVA